MMERGSQAAGLQSDRWDSCLASGMQLPLPLCGALLAQTQRFQGDLARQAAAGSTSA